MLAASTMWELSISWINKWSPVVPNGIMHLKHWTLHMTHSHCYPLGIPPIKTRHGIHGTIALNQHAPCLSTRSPCNLSHHRPQIIQRHCLYPQNTCSKRGWWEPFFCNKKFFSAHTCSPSILYRLQNSYNHNFQVLLADILESIGINSLLKLPQLFLLPCHWRFFLLLKNYVYFLYSVMICNAGIQLIINTLVVVKTFKMSNNMRKLCFLCNTV